MCVGAIVYQKDVEERGSLSAKTYVVQSSIRIAIRHHLQSGIGPVLDIGGQIDEANAEFANAEDLEGRVDGDVEVAARVVAQGQQSLDGGLLMLHVQLDGAAGEGKLGTIVGDGILTPAGELGQHVLVITAGAWGDDLKVGRSKDREQQQRTDGGQWGSHYEGLVTRLINRHKEGEGVITTVKREGEGRDRTIRERSDRTSRCLQENMREASVASRPTLEHRVSGNIQTTRQMGQRA